MRPTKHDEARESMTKREKYVHHARRNIHVSRAVILLLALFMLMHAGLARAQYTYRGIAASAVSPGPTRVYAGLHLGGIGKSKCSQKGYSENDNMASLRGFQGGADVVLHKYFAVGGEYRFTSTQFEDAEKDDDRVLLVDFALKPRGRYRLPNIPLEVYGTMPFGASVVAPLNASTPKSMRTTGWVWARPSSSPIIWA